VGLWRFYLNQAKLWTAHALGEQCFALAQRLQDPVSLLEAHLMLGSTLLYLGELASADANLEQGITLCDPQHHRARAVGSVTDLGVVCLARASWTLWILGYPDQALKRSHESLTLAQELSHPYSLCFAWYFATALHQSRRQVQLVQERAEAAISLSSEQGLVLS